MATATKASSRRRGKLFWQCQLMVCSTLRRTRSSSQFPTAKAKISRFDSIILQEQLVNLTPNIYRLRRRTTHDDTLHYKYGAELPVCGTAHARVKLYRLCGSFYIHCCPCAGASATTRFLRISTMIFDHCINLVHRLEESATSAGLAGITRKNQRQGAGPGFIQWPTTWSPSFNQIILTACESFPHSFDNILYVPRREKLENVTETKATRQNRMASPHRRPFDEQ